MNKYHAQKTEADGIIFASAKEARRWQELKLLERAGEIKGLDRQVKYSVDIHGKHICNYFADFVYQEKLRMKAEVWKLVAEDAKGYKTPVYRLKKKLVEAIYGITILET